MSKDQQKVEAFDDVADAEAEEIDENADQGNRGGSINEDDDPNQ